LHSDSAIPGKIHGGIFPGRTPPWRGAIALLMAQVPEPVEGPEPAAMEAKAGTPERRWRKGLSGRISHGTKW